MTIQTDLRISDYRPNDAMAPHAHDEASVNVVVKGEFLERIARGERTYARGHVAFCPAHATHSQQFGAAGVRQIIFRPQDVWLDYLKDCGLKLDEAPHAGSVNLRQLGDRLLAELANNDGLSSLAREGLLLEIVAVFGRSSAPSPLPAAPPAWLRAAHDYLHANPSAPLTLAKIAKAAGRHEIHLAREFRRFYGTSVGDYLRQLRAREAARLLAQSRLSVSEIALTCGFASHSHLCREFKAQFGMTPSQYRGARG